jgi:hypothetical protein
MGNQMFQYAFAHAASRRLGTSFSLGLPSRSKVADVGPPLRTFFDLGPAYRVDVRLARRIAFAARYGLRAPIVTVEQDADPAETLARLRDGVVYGGYFQSEKWFAGYENDIRELFTVRREYQEEFARRYPDRRPYICMHVRRTDYLDTNLWALPTSYFLDALAEVPDRDRYEVVVVSDDPVRVRQELRDVPDMRCDPNHSMVDLLLLMNADVVIASNSSFSWWGAWLNERPGLQVIAPEHWLGFAAGAEEPSGVIPPDWTTVPVRGAPLLADG